MSDSEERTAQQAAARIVRGLAYTTSKFTRIADWRLAVFFYFCQLAVLVGIVASLILGKTFLALEVPIGVISSYASTPSAYATHQAATSAGAITAPCSNLVRPPRGTERAIPPDPTIPRVTETRRSQQPPKTPVDSRLRSLGR